MLEWMEQAGKAADLGSEQFADFQGLRNLEAADPKAVHLREVMSAFFATLTSDEAYHGCQKRGLSAGIIRSPEENLVDPHFREDRGFFAELHHKELDAPALCPGAPYRFEKTPWSLRRPAPRLGEHNQEVYCGELGIAPQEVTRLAEAGVI